MDAQIYLYDIYIIHYIYICTYVWVYVYVYIYNITNTLKRQQGMCVYRCIPGQRIGNKICMDTKAARHDTGGYRSSAYSTHILKGSKACMDTGGYIPVDTGPAPFTLSSSDLKALPIKC
jgi:hypothetical protein